MGSFSGGAMSHMRLRIGASDGASRPESNSDLYGLLAIFAATIIFAGLMFYGYAVFDELVLYCVLVAIALFTGIRAPAVARSKIETIHEYVSIVFMLYLVVETARGMFELGDVRVLRFTAIFASLAWISLKFSRSRLRVFRDTIVRSVVFCSAIYFLLYLLCGVVGELIFDVWRFNLQGEIWVGTTAAFVPGIVMLPALLRIAASSQSRDRFLFWLCTALFFLAAFYYQSRLGWLALILLVMSLVISRRPLRAVVLALAYICFVMFFPWNDPRPLTPTEMRRYIVDVVHEMPLHHQPARNLISFADAVFGTFVNQHMDAEIIAISKTGEVQKFRAQDITKAEVKALKKQGLEVRTVDETALSSDLDRKLAIWAAIRAATHEGVLKLLFGSGYYTHRFVLIPYIQEVGIEHHFVFPPNYDSIVRTATMNGMLVDTGIIGIILFVSMFGITVWTLLMGAWRGGFETIGGLVCSFGALLLLGVAQFAGSNFDMVLVYLAIMPTGCILTVAACARPAGARESEKVSAPQDALPG